MRWTSKKQDEPPRPRLNLTRSLERSARAAIKAFERSGRPFMMVPMLDGQGGHVRASDGSGDVLEPVLFSATMRASYRQACQQAGCRRAWLHQRSAAGEVPPCLAGMADQDIGRCPESITDSRDRLLAGLLGLSRSVAVAPQEPAPLPGVDIPF